MMFNLTIATTYPLALTLPNRSVNEAWYTRDQDLALLEVAMLGLTFSIALFGNSAVLIVLLLRRQKITRMYFFILHLSLADLAVTFLNTLPQMLWEITWRFQGDNMLCKLVKFLQVFASYLSAWTLVMMAYDRHDAICRPLNSYSWRARRCTIMILVAWILSILCAFPQVFVFSQTEILPDIYECWASFVVDWGGKAYVTWFALSIYIIPLCFLIITYGQVTWTVWKVIRLKENGTLRIKPDGKTSIVDKSRERTYSTSSIRSQSTSRSRTTQSTYRRVYNRTKLLTVKLTAVVIMCYIFCWTPFISALLITTYFPDSELSKQLSSVFTVLLNLANLNSCTNPWIYLFFSLGKYIKCKHGWKRTWLVSAHATTSNASELEDLDPTHQNGHSLYSHGSIKCATNHEEKRHLTLNSGPAKYYVFGIPLSKRNSRSSNVAL